MPGDVFAARLAVNEAAVEAADQTVREGAEGLRVRPATGAMGLVVGACTSGRPE